MIFNMDFFPRYNPIIVHSILSPFWRLMPYRVFDVWLIAWLSLFFKSVMKQKYSHLSFCYFDLSLRGSFSLSRVITRPAFCEDKFRCNVASLPGRVVEDWFTISQSSWDHWFGIHTNTFIFRIPISIKALFCSPFRAHRFSLVLCYY